MKKFTVSLVIEFIYEGGSIALKNDDNVPDSVIVDCLNQITKSIANRVAQEAIQDLHIPGSCYCRGWL